VSQTSSGAATDPSDTVALRISILGHSLHLWQFDKDPVRVVRVSMKYRIYLRNFHGRDGYFEVTLRDNQMIKDFETYLRGEQFKVSSYSTDDRGGSLTLDFHEVLAIQSVSYGPA
jgi:hypothetical protein